VNKVPTTSYKGWEGMLWCLTPLSTIFQLLRSDQVLVEEAGVGENPDLPQVTDKLYHIILYHVV
jgi:hypothetical protein